MKTKFYLILIFLVISNIVNAQDKTCDCGKDIRFLTDSYLNDYSGMQDFINKNPRYLSFIDSLQIQANNTSNIFECDSLINKFIKYLNNGHVNYGATQINPVKEIQGTKNNFDINKLRPKLNFIDDKTAYFEIKTAELFLKQTLDSLIYLNKEKLDTTEHFIVDIRGNSGGGDAMFNELMPYLYTNPIIAHSVEFWASENNLKMFEEYLINPNIPKESKDVIKRIIDKGKRNINQFVLISDNKIDTLKLERPLLFPKKISLIIDGQCASATEQFILFAKQSRKTIIYGYENSAGVLDYSNLNTISTPSGLWYATIPTTRSTRLPDKPVDPDGIQPDILVDKNINDIVNFIIKTAPNKPQ